MLSTDDGAYFVCDTHVNANPTAEEIVEITLMAAEKVLMFGVRPRVALLSHSAFGSHRDDSAMKMKQALALLRERSPDLEVEGEMTADMALDENYRKSVFPNSRLRGPANLLVMPNLDSAHIAYNLARVISNGVTVGPMLLGVGLPAHVLTPSATARRIVNMTAIAVVEAQIHEKKHGQWKRPAGNAGMNLEFDKLHHDSDPLETQEWLESLQAVIGREGPDRAHYLLEKLVDFTRRSGGYLPYDATTAYINTIPPHLEKRTPGNAEMEYRIRSLIRWNAMATVLRASKRGGELGGHIASFASAATLYDVGFNHFFRGPDHPGGGDLVYIQGHSSPGIYARSFLEGRISEEQLDKFREESEGKGLSSYPHPWLMPNYWQLPTVSMGLGPIMAIYQARFLKYLHNRGIADTSDRRVWCFLGDGETDEPESLGAISLAGREKLNNLIFVVNCNLQRLDGPVRGNGKIIQELESVFRGAGWSVFKVIWGAYWDPLFAKDKDGLLRKRMEEALDGDYQNYKAKGGAYTREHFFGEVPGTAGDGREHVERRHLAAQSRRS